MMKLYPTIRKLSLISLLAAGLVSSPLIANASTRDNDRDRYDHHQPDRGKHHQRDTHKKARPDYRQNRKYDNPHGYHKGCSLGYASKHHYYKPHKYYGHVAKARQHHADKHQYEHPRFLLRLFSSY